MDQNHFSDWSLWKFLCCSILLLLILNINSKVIAQDSDFWKWASVQHEKSQDLNSVKPKAFKSINLNWEKLNSVLIDAPDEEAFGSLNSIYLLEIPFPDEEGCSHYFNVAKSSIMAPGLAARYPEIQSFIGQGIDDPTATLRMDISPKGWKVQVIGQEGTYYIDPVSPHETKKYLCYWKKDNRRPIAPFECELLELGQRTFDEAEAEVETEPKKMKTGGVLFTFRLAVSATGEYTQFHGGAVSDGLAAINTTINRVNGIYEREISLRLILIDDTDQLIYTNGSTDPYDNNDSNMLVNQSQSNIDDVIGPANYDIGHTVSTGGGGLAALGVLCDDEYKATGITGRSNPVGDSFDLDYVAHELGHQLGGKHTFNGNVGSCSGANRTPISAYEPGSGTTIMGYAGICSPQNIQTAADDYFHAISLFDIFEEIQNDGAACANQSPTGNTAPISEAGVNTFIPKSTPFTLSGIASDPQGHAMTYCWEQLDLGDAGHPDSPIGNAPIFRSFPPSTSLERTFPQWSDIVSNSQTMGELLPNYGRTLHFSFTARDNRSFGGCFSLDVRTISVVDAAGPFEITQAGSSSTWTIGETEEVRWNVAATDQAPILCDKVDIYLSKDGGYTYPYLILDNAPNVGSAFVEVPNYPGNSIRIQVKANNSVFFDINDSDLSIVAPSSPIFLMSTLEDEFSICAPSILNLPIYITGISGFISPINFSINGLPTGLNANFGPGTISPNPLGQTQLSLSNTVAVNSGTYPLSIVANGGGISRTANIILNLYNDVPNSPSNYIPIEGAQQQSLKPYFQWEAISDADEYRFFLSSNPSFSTLIEVADELNPSHQLVAVLNSQTTYYWRVRATNECGDGAYSPTYSFVTDVPTCKTFSAADLPKAISGASPNSITSDLWVEDRITITDVNVPNISGTHSWINDLKVSLSSPHGTVVSLWERICNGHDNFNSGFDDSASNSNSSLPCPPTDNELYQPLHNLNDFNGEFSQGNWTIKITDIFASDGGALNDWSVEICGVYPPTPKTLRLKVLLEGPYQGASQMTTNLNSSNLVPLISPFEQSPWFYTNQNDEILASLPNDVVDWVLVELRDAANPEVVVERQAALLYKNGIVGDPDGTSNGVNFYYINTSSEYLVSIRARNHLSVMSQNPIQIPNNSVLNFSQTANVFDGENQLTNLGDGRYAMLAGDINSDGVITVSDFNFYIPQSSLISQYATGDLNLDKNVTVSDFNLYQTNSGAIGIEVLRY